MYKYEVENIQPEGHYVMRELLLFHRQWWNFTYLTYFWTDVSLLTVTILFPSENQLSSPVYFHLFHSFLLVNSLFCGILSKALIKSQ